MDVLFRTNLFRLDFRSGGPTVRLCDGGVINWGGEQYQGSDPLFGSVQAAEAISEGAGDDVPNMRLTLAIGEAANWSDVVSADWQNSRVRWWIGTYAEATSTISGTPTLMFSGILDSIERTSARGQRLLQLTLAGSAARALAINDGNTLNPTWHKSIWPNETGEDQAIRLGPVVAWGIAAPTGASVAGVSGSGGGGAGGGVGGGGRIFDVQPV